MTIEERISLVEEQVADMLLKYDKLIHLYELLQREHIYLKEQHQQLRTETDQQKVETDSQISLLCAMIGLTTDQLTNNLNLLDFPDLLRERLANQQN